MTVNSQQNKISYVGNGVATEFAIPFSYLDKSHLSVWQMLNGVQSERTDWTAANGTLIFKTAPENNAQIVIMRQVPLTQETDYRENEILPAETLERCFDKLTMQVQQLEEKSGRAVTVDVFDDTNAASLIPSIRKAVSDCTAAASSAQSSASAASEKAAQAQTAATNAAATLASKANADLSNCTKPYVTETYRNGTEWYRLWSDGWLEQGGALVSNSSFVVYNFLKPFADTNYALLCAQNSGGLGEQSNGMVISKQSESTFGVLFTLGSTGLTYTWQAKGKAV